VCFLHVATRRDPRGERDRSAESGAAAEFVSAGDLMAMKIDDKAAAALRDSSTQAIPIDMTPERKELFQRISGEIVDLLKRNTSGPIEAYMILHFVMLGFEENYGIRGGIVMGDDAKEV
jgi:hypothetical protein